MASAITGGGGGSFQAGTGTGTYKASGDVNTFAVATGTIADTNETVLWTYTLPANSLNANGTKIRIRAWGACAANANNKTMRLYFGATVLNLSGTAAFNNNTFQYDAIVIRTGAATQVALAVGDTATAGAGLAGTNLGNHIQTAPTEDTTAAIVVKVTGQNAVASANDILLKGAVVEFGP